MSDPKHKDAPAFDFYPERFWFAVEGWTDREIVAYFRLLSQQWLRDGLPEAESDLKGLARCKISARVISKFPISNDGLRRNLFLEEIREKQRSRIEAGREKARKMAASRWSKEKSPDATSIPTSTAQAMLEPCPPLTNHHSPVQSHSTSEPEARAEIPGVGEKTPTIEFIRAIAARNMITEEIADAFFHAMEAVHWIDAKQRPIRKPESALIGWARNWRENEAKNPKSKKPAPGPIVERSFWGDDEPQDSFGAPVAPVDKGAAA